MTAVLNELTGAGNTDIRSAVVNNGSGGAHSAKVNAFKACGVDFAGFPVDGHAVEVACFGGEINSVGGFVVCNIGTKVANKVGNGAYHFSGVFIEHEQFGVALIAAVAVVGADNYVFIGGVCARPIEAAFGSVSPKSVFFLGGVAWVFVGSINANKVCVSGFVVPEAGIYAAVFVNDSAVRLTAKLVLVNPKGFKGVCAERLNTTACKTYENHTVRIGRRNDGEAGSARHGSGGNGFAGFFINLDDVFACVSVDVAVHNNRGADCAAAVTVTGLLCPNKLGISKAGRSLSVGNSHIFVVAAESRPVRAEVGVLNARNFLESDYIFAVGKLLGIVYGARCGNIAFGSGGVGVGFASGKDIFAVFIRCELVAVFIVNTDYRIFNVGGKLCFVSTDFVELEGVSSVVGAVVGCFNSNLKLGHFGGKLYIAFVNRVAAGGALGISNGSVGMSEFNHVAFRLKACLIAYRKLGHSILKSDGVLGYIRVKLRRNRNGGVADCKFLDGNVQDNIDGIVYAVGAAGVGHVKNKSVFTRVYLICIAYILRNILVGVGGGEVVKGYCIVAVYACGNNGAPGCRNGYNVKCRKNTAVFIEVAVIHFNSVFVLVLLEGSFSKQRAIHGIPLHIVIIAYVHIRDAVAGFRNGNFYGVSSGAAVRCGYGIGNSAFAEVNSFAGCGRNACAGADNKVKRNAAYIGAVVYGEINGAVFFVNSTKACAEFCGSDFLFRALAYAVINDYGIAFVAAVKVSHPLRFLEGCGGVAHQRFKHFAVAKVTFGNGASFGVNIPVANIADGVALAHSDIEQVCHFVLAVNNAKEHTHCLSIVAVISGGNCAGVIAVVYDTFANNAADTGPVAVYIAFVIAVFCFTAANNAADARRNGFNGVAHGAVIGSFDFSGVPAAYCSTVAGNAAGAAAAGDFAAVAAHNVRAAVTADTAGAVRAGVTPAGNVGFTADGAGVSALNEYAACVCIAADTAGVGFAEVACAAGCVCGCIHICVVYAVFKGGFGCNTYNTRHIHGSFDVAACVNNNVLDGCVFGGAEKCFCSVRSVGGELHVQNLVVLTVVGSHKRLCRVCAIAAAGLFGTDRQPCFAKLRKVKVSGLYYIKSFIGSARVYIVAEENKVVHIFNANRVVLCAASLFHSVYGCGEGVSVAAAVAGNIIIMNGSAKVNLFAGCRRNGCAGSNLNNGLYFGKVAALIENNFYGGVCFVNKSNAVFNCYALNAEAGIGFALFK